MSASMSGRRLHDQLSSYEARRRLAYSNKFESSNLYWKSFRDLLQASLQETARAQRLVLGTSRAHQMYADAMEAMYNDDFLDEKDNVVFKAGLYQRLAKGSFFGKKSAAPLPTPANQQKNEPSADKNTIVSSVRGANRAIAEQFEANARETDLEIADELGTLLKTLQDTVERREKIGNGILSELERTEKEVANAWKDYYLVASKRFNGNSVPEFTPSSDTNNLSKDQQQAKDASGDLWLVEMRYRVAVAYQNEAWDKGGSELSTLFDKMREEECRRRMALREYLVAFAQRQQRFFTSLPTVHNPVLDDLMGRKMSKEEMESSIQTAIRDRAEQFQRMQESDRKICMAFEVDPDPKKSDNDNEDEDDPTLLSPLSSELLQKAQVIERKGQSVVQPWRRCLAVTTADSFLHLFDLNSASSGSGPSPEAAFRELSPSIFSSDSETSGEAFTGFSRGWLESLMPAESVVLANCSIQPLDDTSFELTETVAGSVASKMFGKAVSYKTIVLKAPTYSEAEDWISALTT